MKKLIMSLALIASALAAAAAADMSNGADNFYQSKHVTSQKVTFKNQYKMTVAGNLFVPKNLESGAKTPAIIVGHPMGAVKEQSSNLYAQKLAEQGFVTLVHRSAFLGRERGAAAQCGVAGCLCRGFQRGGGFPRHPAICRSVRGLAFSGFAAAGALSSARPRLTRGCEAIATVSMYDMGGAESARARSVR